MKASENPMNSDHTNLPVTRLARAAIRPGRCRATDGLLRLLAVTLLAVLFALGASCSAHAAGPSQVQTAEGLTVYIGLLPAAIIKGYPETMMHGGKPSGRDEFHLIVAIFDAANGQRVSDATVSARVAEAGLVGQTRQLAPMPIAGVVTYGGYFALPPMARYVVRIVVTRAGGSPATFDFTYDRPHQ